MIYDSQAFPNAKRDCLAINPKAVCKKNWSLGSYDIHVNGEVFHTGNGSPSGAWVDYAFKLGVYTALGRKSGY